VGPFSWNLTQDLEWGSFPILSSIKIQSQKKIIPYEEGKEMAASSLVAPNFDAQCT
jgi:hypothetical protein